MRGKTARHRAEQLSIENDATPTLIYRIIRPVNFILNERITLSEIIG